MVVAGLQFLGFAVRQLRLAVVGLLVHWVAGPLLRMAVVGLELFWVFVLEVRGTAAAQKLPCSRPGRGILPL